MRHKRNGFTNFMQKLDGVKDDDNFSETEGLGSELYQRYGILLGVLRGYICWGTYLGRMLHLSTEERHYCWEIRRASGITNIPSDPVGVYFSDGGCAYRKAVEYIREHFSGEQQDGFSTTPF